MDPAQEHVRMVRFTESGGEVVVGNFGEYNPTRNYMELLGGWRLIHRSGEHLRNRAVPVGKLQGRGTGHRPKVRLCGKGHAVQQYQ